MKDDHKGLEHNALLRGMKELGLKPKPGQVSTLLDYLDLVHSWNRTHNLTGTRDRRDMLSRHLLDSLAIVPYIFGTRLLDVGSGAGFPGFPVAIACPGVQVTTLDSRRKKTEFQKFCFWI